MAKDEMADPAAGIRIVEYSPAQFAQSLKEFYDELVRLEFEQALVEKLMVAFCSRP